MTMADLVRDQVFRAFKLAYGERLTDETLEAAVKHPGETHRAAEVKGAVCVIFTEYGGLSQYGNNEFWKELNPLLAAHGLYYEWLDGGTATIWPIF